MPSDSQTHGPQCHTSLLALFIVEVPYSSSSPPTPAHQKCRRQAGTSKLGEALLQSPFLLGLDPSEPCCSQDPSSQRGSEPALTAQHAPLWFSQAGVVWGVFCLLFMPLQAVPAECQGWPSTELHPQTVLSQPCPLSCCIHF